MSSNDWDIDDWTKPLSPSLPGLTTVIDLPPGLFHVAKSMEGAQEAKPIQNNTAVHLKLTQYCKSTMLQKKKKKKKRTARVW